VVQTEATENYGNLSPDGKYLAYSSDETRKSEVYVRSFPGTEGKFQISNYGGDRPVWSRDGKELFYLSADQKIMAVTVKAGATFEYGRPQLLFAIRTTTTGRYDVSADGKRFLVIQGATDAPAPTLMVVLNWQAGLKK
jgi:hypothetical protein